MSASDSDSDDQIDEPMPPVDVDLDALEREIDRNPTNYGAYVKLIDACRSNGELERLRSARIRMRSVYPLSPKLWRDWIDDEKQFTKNQSDHVKFMKELCDRAVADYTSFDVWLDYIQWAVGCGDHSLTREICESAVSAVGLHVGRGCLIWDAYRIFEKALLDIQICQEELNSSDSRNSTAAGEAVEKQKAIYVSIFKRQLNLPLLGMETTFKEYEEFCASSKESVDTTLLNNYKNNLSTLEKLKPFEQALVDTEIDESTSENESKTKNLKAYQDYIDFEVKNSNSPARIKCLFERAITDHCLDCDLWVKYLNWLNRKLRIKSEIASACHRATRNCPWSTKIWQHYLLSFERWNFDIFRDDSEEIPAEKIQEINNDSEKILDNIFQRALNEGGYTTATECCQLWLTRIYQIKRNVEKSPNKVYESLRKAFEDGSTFLKEKFSELGWDSDCQFRLCWARAEGLFLKDLTKFRKIFDEIMAEGGNGKKAQAWLQYFGLEREFNPHDGQYARKILIKAVNSVSDYPESIFAQFLQFELEFGTLSDYDDALHRIEQQRGRLKERNQPKVHNKNEPTKKRYHPKEDGTSPAKTVSKRKFEDTKIQSSTPKKSKTAEPREQPSAVQSKSDFDFVAPAPPTSSKPALKPINKPSGPKAPLNTTQAGIDSSKYDRTVFVSNLDFAVSDETLRTIFEENVGRVTSIRLIMLRPGRSKGFGYVEFQEPSSLSKALELDRYKIDGRPMYVSECVDKKSGDQQSSSSSANIPPHGFTYSTGIEKNKLFVKNLHGRTTEADLEQFFKPYGRLVSVRLVIHKSGQSKGLAYVEFADEQSANKALMATDQSIMMGRRITVAISNPPPKQSKIGVEDQQIRERPRPAASTNVSLMPRTLSSNSTQRRPHLASGVNRQNGDKSTIENQSTAMTTNGSGGVNAGKSNDEFRKMIMK